MPKHSGSFYTPLHIHMIVIFVIQNCGEIFPYTWYWFFSVQWARRGNQESRQYNVFLSRYFRPWQKPISKLDIWNTHLCISCHGIRPTNCKLDGIVVAIVLKNINHSKPRSTRQQQNSLGMCTSVLWQGCWFRDYKQMYLNKFGML